MSANIYHWQKGGGVWWWCWCSHDSSSTIINDDVKNGSIAMFYLYVLGDNFGKWMWYNRTRTIRIDGNKQNKQTSIKKWEDKFSWTNQWMANSFGDRQFELSQHTNRVSIRFLLRLVQKEGRRKDKSKKGRDRINFKHSKHTHTQTQYELSWLLWYITKQDVSPLFLSFSMCWKYSSLIYNVYD